MALLAGAVLGLLLGALGGGASVLTVPVLVYGLGQGTTAAGGAVGTGNDVRAARLCHRTARHPGGQARAPAALLLGFTALMLLAAVGTLRRDGPPQRRGGLPN